MQTIWKLIETNIIPFITHAMEMINLTKTEILLLITRQCHMNKILESIIERTLNTSVTTLREAVYIKVRLLDLESYTNKQWLLMYN